MFEKKTKFRLTFENWNWKNFKTRKTGHCFFRLLAHLKHVFVAEVGHLWTSKVRSLFFLIFFFNHSNFDFIFLSKKYSRCDNWYLGTVGVKYYYSRTMRLYTHTQKLYQWNGRSQTVVVRLQVVEMPLSRHPLPPSLINYKLELD